jgi:ABC-type cobalt transport system substrate-binding protein
MSPSRCVALGLLVGLGASTLTSRVTASLSDNATDTEASALARQLAPAYDPTWAPSPSMRSAIPESAGFASQAMLGGGLLGWAIGVRRRRDAQP